MFLICLVLGFFPAGVGFFLTEQPYSWIKQKAVEFSSMFLDLPYKLITPFLHIPPKNELN